MASKKNLLKRVGNNSKKSRNPSDLLLLIGTEIQAPDITTTILWLVDQRPLYNNIENLFWDTKIVICVKAFHFNLRSCTWILASRTKNHNPRVYYSHLSHDFIKFLIIALVHISSCCTKHLGISEAHTSKCPINNSDKTRNTSSIDMAAKTTPPLFSSEHKQL